MATGPLATGSGRAVFSSEIVKRPLRPGVRALFRAKRALGRVYVRAREKAKRVARNAALARAGRRMGREGGFRGAIDQRDYLMHYVLLHSAQGIQDGPEAGLREYFDQGARDARQVMAVMQELGHAPAAKVLEFASGYGRVTRHLPLSDLTACDIHPEAVSFLRRRLNVAALQSAPSPAEFDPATRYDFVFVLSLFSHLPEHLFEAWLAKLASLLKPGGHLMFTTNGETAIAMVERIAAGAVAGARFSFWSETDQPDLEAAIYGTAVVTSHYVRETVARTSRCRVVSHRPGSWWGTQDEWIIAADG